MAGAAVFFVFAFVIASVYSLPTNIDPFIIGGEAVANNTEFPYQVAIIKKADKTLICSGALIDQDFVLTTAHCASSIKPEDSQAIVGNIIVSDATSGDIFDIKKVYKHEDFTEAGLRVNDIALIKLNQTLNTTDSVHPVDIDGSSPNNNITCVLTGWGASQNGGTFNSSVPLQKVNIVTLGKEDCQNTIWQGFELDKQICAGGQEENKNGCTLDEGDPFTCSDKLVGLLSSASYCGTKDKPSIYTDVTAYRQWINDTKVIMNSAAVKCLNIAILVASMTAVMAFWN